MDTRSNTLLAYSVIGEALANPGSVQLYEHEGIYYVPTESVQDYMFASGTIDIDEALDNIAEANDINTSDIACVGIFDEDFLPEDNTAVTYRQVKESAVLLEKAVEDGAMSLKQAKKAYNKILSKAKSVPQTKEELDRVISSLETCIKNMKKEKSKVENEVKTKGRVKYSLKALIPFNSLYKVLKAVSQGHRGTKAQVDEYEYKYIAPYLSDFIWIIAASITGTAAVPGAVALGTKVGATVYSMWARYDDYANVLDAMIKDSEEALKFLKDKRDKLKDKK